MADGDHAPGAFWVPTQSATDRDRFTYTVPQAACVGPYESQFLMGGVSMAACIHALETATGLPLLWATVQFAGATGLGSDLDIAVTRLAEGRSATQAVADLTAGTRVVVHMAAALGGVPEAEGHQFAQMPDVPAPMECAPSHDIPFARPDNLAGRIERREAYQNDETGEEHVWVRVRDAGIPDAPLLALMSDFFLGAHSKTRGGRSLDNTVRMHAPAGSDWVLNVTRMSGFSSGVAHGTLHQFDQNGTLLTTASQTGFMARPHTLPAGTR
ncbi:thioesterase family protein [Hyphomonas sp.]|uniref:acyl-CoA thioesterase n=1 Tax=Hyphomonas sp. TaxID=87 RepID=UPI0025B8C3C1|nr:thioesterase family protein [Hyphomonas sp.]